MSGKMKFPKTEHSCYGVSDCYTLGEIRELIEGFIDKYGEQAQYDIEYDRDYIQESVTWQKEETDEEYQNRIKSEQLEKEQKEHIRYKQYLALKKEFEGE